MGYEGRQLKIGAIPLKQKDEDVRLYAEFQTQLYLAPPVKDGIVPKISTETSMCIKIQCCLNIL